MRPKKIKADLPSLAEEPAKKPKFNTRQKGGTTPIPGTHQ